ncbi:hypothetical protein XENTR_v10002372 [Xenopus tropicalis]|nr:hypothetical protein XENTR_v10002372 [Xenopus tropicalis]
MHLIYPYTSAMTSALNLSHIYQLSIIILNMCFRCLHSTGFYAKVYSRNHMIKAVYSAMCLHNSGFLYTGLKTN